MITLTPIGDRWLIAWHCDGSWRYRTVGAWTWRLDDATRHTATSLGAALPHVLSDLPA